jgi:hypothetical protein
MDLWAYQNGVRMAFSRPEKLMDNAFWGSFNETFRAECVNAHSFTSSTEAQHIGRILRRAHQYQQETRRVCRERSERLCRPLIPRDDAPYDTSAPIRGFERLRPGRPSTDGRIASTTR